MESKLRALPPLKRLRLLHQEKQQSQSILLPAKKRKQSRQPSKSTEFSPPTPTSFCLPAKKRVWAIRPDFSPPTKSPPTSFDLNLEYTPSPQKHPDSSILHNPPNENTDFEEPKESLSKDEILGAEQANPDEEDDDGILCAVSDSSDGDPSNVKTDLEEPTEPLSEDGILGPELANPDKDGTVQQQAEEDDGIVRAVCENPDGDPQTENTDEILGSEQANPDEEEEEDDDGILCAVCESTDGDPSDPIVFCDGCDLMVHASCYGNPLVNCIPEGDWFCAQCSLSKSSIRCCLCPAKGGAMKPTTDGKWAHIICALLVPEVFFEDPDGREGINCDKIPKKRWREICYVCKRRKRGCVVDCSEQKCGLSFHVSCGLKEELCIELKEGKYSGGVVAAFCKDHTQLWKKQQQTGKFRIVARED